MRYGPQLAPDEYVNGPVACGRNEHFANFGMMNFLHDDVSCKFKVMIIGSRAFNQVFKCDDVHYVQVSNLNREAE
jgi:hypothetical protein